jgi:hypothetical protein
VSKLKVVRTRRDLTALPTTSVTRSTDDRRAPFSLEIVPNLLLTYSLAIFHSAAAWADAGAHDREEVL